MHKVLLSIGTNTNARFNMEQAIEVLLSYFPNINFTNIIKTKPFGTAYKKPFLNALAYLETEMNKSEVELLLKTIEKDMGRLPSHKREGKVIIDIDLIKWDNEILKPTNFEYSFMPQLLLEVREITEGCL